MNMPKLKKDRRFYTYPDDNKNSFFIKGRLSDIIINSIPSLKSIRDNKIRYNNYNFPLPILDSYNKLSLFTDILNNYKDF